MADLIRAVVEMKKRNSTWGCPQIADQINLAFGTSNNKDVVRRILALQVPAQAACLDPPPRNAAGNCKFLNQATYSKVLTHG